MSVDLVMSCSNSTTSYLVINTANMMVLEDSKACPLGRLQWWIPYINSNQKKRQSPLANPTLKTYLKKTVLLQIAPSQ